MVIVIISAAWPIITRPAATVHVGWSAGMMPIERSICLVELENFTYSLRMITPISLFCDRLYV
jgi:hypothetical protein